MTPSARRYLRSQDGYTLIEVIIAVAIGAILMTALTSVVLTSVRASNVAVSRVEASAQVRNFEFFAADDFDSSGVPSANGCGTPATPCTTQSIILMGTSASNSVPPVAAPSLITYTWDGSDLLDRRVGSGAPIHAATGVTAFSWYVDTSAAHPTVVLSLTITVQAYSESQTLLFYPRVAQ